MQSSSDSSDSRSGQKSSPAGFRMTATYEPCEESSAALGRRMPVDGGFSKGLGWHANDEEDVSSTRMIASCSIFIVMVVYALVVVVVRFVLLFVAAGSLSSELPSWPAVHQLAFLR